jgi:hypothetical protein
MLTVVTWKWRSDYRVTYTAHHVNVLRDMVLRNYSGPIRFVCITDDPQGIEGETFPLWTDCAELRNASGAQLPSCYRRLRLFDPETQAMLGIRTGERVVSLDLDTVILGSLNPLWDRDEPFVGWSLPGTYHPRVFNGSMWMIRGGAEAHVWRDFDPETSPGEARNAQFLGSDQSWMSYRLQGRAGWTDADGVASYPLNLRYLVEHPADVRVAMFHGKQKPWMPGVQPWVRENWRLKGKGRCLILGYAPSVWDEAAIVLTDPFDGVIASPEAADHWPGEVVAVGHNDEECEHLAMSLGYDEIVFCGRQVAA